MQTTSAPSSKKRPRRPEESPRPDDLIDKHVLAYTLGVEVATIESWTLRKKLPKPIKLGNSRNSPIRWRWRDIQAWIAAHEAASATAESERHVAAGGAR